MTKKRVLSLVTVFLLLCAAVPASAATSCRPASQFGGWRCAVPGGQSAAAKPEAPASPIVVDQNGMASLIVSETNAERAKRGLRALTVDPDLTAAAQVRAREIAQVFSHTRPDGSSCFTVSAKVFGENIARGHNSVSRVMAAWMTSDGHRANILRASYGSIGVACIQSDGIFCWVQLFGR